MPPPPNNNLGKKIGFILGVDIRNFSIVCTSFRNLYCFTYGPLKHMRTPDTNFPISANLDFNIFAPRQSEHDRGMTMNQMTRIRLRPIMIPQRMAIIVVVASGPARRDEAGGWAMPLGWPAGE
jgi:hypothetical protein